jgi:predicted O-methyltransferase YrrM
MNVNGIIRKEINMMKFARKFIPLLLLMFFLVAAIPFFSATVTAETGDLDTRVKKFLDTHDWGWGDMNVPAVDGRTLHDIIIKNKYTRAVEIGTSTGHSTIWIAWALSKTGGKLITIEIDEGRYREAMENFEAAGLSEFIDARLGDAHEIVPALEGPFDFVFSDADKNWYKNYLIALLPKLEVGGCYTTHNVSSRRRGRRGGGRNVSYLDYLYSLPNLETTVDDRGAGLSISYKKSQ